MRNKSIFFIFFVKIMFLVPLVVKSQSQDRFEFELHYGRIKTINHLNLNSYTSPYSSIITTKENNLKTPQYGMAIGYHFNKRIALKLGYGTFQNGRTLSVITTYSSDDFSPPIINTFENIENKYFYRYYSLSQIFKLDFIFDTQVEIENGFMVLKDYEVFDTRFYKTKEYNYQYFLKLGVTKKIKNKIRFSVRSTFFHGLQNFTWDIFEEGLLPFSFGGEIGVSYIFLKKES